MGQNEYIRHYLRLINLTLFDLRRRETEKHSDLCLFYCFLLVHCIFVIFEYTILVYYYIEWRMMTIEMKWNSSYLYWRIISTNRLSSFFFCCLFVCLLCLCILLHLRWNASCFCLNSFTHSYKSIRPHHCRRKWKLYVISIYKHMTSTHTHTHTNT